MAFSVSMAPVDVDHLARQLAQHETGGMRENLAWWSPHEPFPSLGIGHFIWLPENVVVPFEAQFPQWVRYARQQGVAVPAWLQAPHAPWASRKAFYADPRRKALLSWLAATQRLQAQFVMERFLHRWVRACASQPDCALLDRRLQRVWRTPGGAYAVLDYSNFKGLGDYGKERYGGKGWGLIQVLRAMPSGSDPLPAFVAAAKAVLRQRIENAPKDESRWWPGWERRLDHYLRSET